MSGILGDPVVLRRHSVPLPRCFIFEGGRIGSETFVQSLLKERVFEHDIVEGNGVIKVTQLPVVFVFQEIVVFIDGLLVIIVWIVGSVVVDQLGDVFWQFLGKNSVCLVGGGVLVATSGCVWFVFWIGVVVVVVQIVSDVLCCVCCIVSQRRFGSGIGAVAVG